MDGISASAADTYRYLNFDKMDSYEAAAEGVELSDEYKTNLEKEVERLRAVA